MKKGFLLLLTVSLSLGIAMVNVPAIFAQEEEASVVQNEEQATGEIISVSSEYLSAVVKYIVNEELQSYRTSTFYFTNATEIKNGDKTLKFADLKAGDKIALHYAQEDGWKKAVVSAIVTTE